MSPNDADGMANSVDPDQTRSSLIWVCTVWLDLPVRKLRNITVISLETAMGHYANLLMVGREIKKCMLWSFWIFQNNMIGKKLGAALLFSFYHFLCSIDVVHLKLIINITLGRNNMTKHVCYCKWYARAHMIPWNENIFLQKLAGNSTCRKLSVDGLFPHSTNGWDIIHI